MSAYETVTVGRSKRSTAGNRMRELLEKAHQEDDDELFAEVEDDEEFAAPQEQRDVFLDEFADTDEEVEEDEEETERAIQREERKKAKGKSRAIYNPLATQPKSRKPVETTATVLNETDLALLDPALDPSSMAPSTLMLALRRKRREVKRLGRSEARRSNLRASTLKTEEEIKAREQAEKAARGNKGRKPQHETGEVRGQRRMTQDELIAAALEEEERNKEALRDWLKKEDEKRELRRVGRKRVKGPRWTWVSRTVNRLVEVVEEAEKKAEEEKATMQVTEGAGELKKAEEDQIGEQKMDEGSAIPIAGHSVIVAEKDADQDMDKAKAAAPEQLENATQSSTNEQADNASKPIPTIPVTEMVGQGGSAPETAVLVPSALTQAPSDAESSRLSVNANGDPPQSSSPATAPGSMAPNHPDGNPTNSTMPERTDAAAVGSTMPPAPEAPKQPVADAATPVTSNSVANQIAVPDVKSPLLPPSTSEVATSQPVSEPKDAVSTTTSFPPSAPNDPVSGPSTNAEAGPSSQPIVNPVPKPTTASATDLASRPSGEHDKTVVQAPTDEASQYTRNYLILSQVPGGLPAELKLVLGDHVEWDEVVYIPARNRPIIRRPPTCPFTGLPAKYRHPTTMIPYANADGYKSIEALLANRYKYDQGGWWLGGEEDMYAEGMDEVEGWWEAVNGGWLGGAEIPPEPEVEPELERITGDAVATEAADQGTVDQEEQVEVGPKGKMKRKRGKGNESVSATPEATSKKAKSKKGKVKAEVTDPPIEPEPESEAVDTPVPASKKGKSKAKKK